MEDSLRSAVGNLSESGTDEEPLTLLRKRMDTFVQNLAQARSLMDQGNGENFEVKEFSPILELAHAYQCYMNETKALRGQIEKKDGEILELKKAVRAKMEEISEIQLRKEMMERKIENTGKEGDDRVIRLQQLIDEINQKSKKNEQEVQKTLDSFQQEIDALENENADLKNRLNLAAKKAVLGNISADGSPKLLSIQPSSGSSVSTVESQLVRGLQTEIEMLRYRLMVTRQEKMEDEVHRTTEVMRNLPPLILPRTCTSFYVRHGTADQKYEQRRDEFHKLIRDFNRFKKVRLCWE
ncbi:unnamed protein product [Soboliphyme baturini]|uniref:Uncharacterized protein n=1 Tax=Soboliphyme baturini TaxID=241478 RepID=A0A183IZ05_9BILA|nr:unnamed protein product [Soboliphyme baturini]